MATCTEFSCGCIVHPYAGTIRKCNALMSRSLSGKPAAKSDSSDAKHKESKITATYEVAAILP